MQSFMAGAFLELCDRAFQATKFISYYEQCVPYYQPVLDYILSHPQERDEMAKTLCNCVAEGGYTQISLVQFLMETLRWPEIKSVAEKRCEQEGNMYLEIKGLVDLYNSPR